MQAMVVPIRSSLDIFVSISPAVDDRLQPLHPRFHSEAGGANLHGAIVGEKELKTWIADFQPVATLISKVELTYNARLQDCWRLATLHEQKRRQEYRWFLRLRPDVAYTTRLPEWPAWAELPAGPLLLTEAVTGFANGTYRRLGACVKDVWGLASRSAAEAYFAERWPPSCSSGKPSGMGTNECRLGCAMHKARVSLGMVPVERFLIRPWLNETPPVVGLMTTRFGRLSMCGLNNSRCM